MGFESVTEASLLCEDYEAVLLKGSWRPMKPRGEQTKTKQGWSFGEIRVRWPVCLRAALHPPHESVS